MSHDTSFGVRLINYNTFGIHLQYHRQIFCQMTRIGSIAWHHLMEYHQVYVYNKQKHARN